MINTLSKAKAQVRISNLKPTDSKAMQAYTKMIA
jgi:hypothetical protein